jgi:sulfate-transporting ATPase
MDQNRDDFTNGKTVSEHVSDGVDVLSAGKFQMASSACHGYFNLQGADRQEQPDTLSVGAPGR